MGFTIHFYIIFGTNLLTGGCDTPKIFIWFSAKKNFVGFREGHLNSSKDFPLKTFSPWRGLYFGIFINTGVWLLKTFLLSFPSQKHFLEFIFF